jgi:DNA mismatch repair ATPase MutS
MKVFLMYPDRDFDPKQKLPPNEAVLTQDLELNTLFDAMARGDEFLFETAKQAVLSSLDTPEEIRYRQEILKDCLNHPDIIRQIYSIPLQAIERKRKQWMGIFGVRPSSILSSALRMLELFVELLKILKQIANEHAGEFESQGFRRFFAMIQQELDDEYFAVVEKHLKELSFPHGALLSAELGRGNEGANYILRKPNHNNRNWVKRVIGPKSQVYSHTLPPRDEHGARALGELRDKGVNLVANAVGQSADHIDSFLTVLRQELAFYIGCLNLSEQLAHLEEPITFPQPALAGERRHSFTGLYDVSLALTMKQKIVGNEVNADGKDLVMITGANQGGKSTFLRSIGLAQLMMQCGMFIPAESFSANLCSGLFTHYKREEDTSMESGKFDEELGRMSVIVDTIKPDTLVLFNESFAATNEREGSEIARQIVNALLVRRIKVFFVTHLYDLAHSFYKKGMENAHFLRAERQPDGSRTFKLIDREPLPTSFGKDVYQRVFEGEGRGHPESQLQA